ncbi:MAG TPA: heparinase II/III family protein [Candidatus Hydrogenedentes bacterium]|nr:heparinase II/III family protein [Candidatus Hydrogenedentota bacterium]
MPSSPSPSVLRALLEKARASSLLPELAARTPSAIAAHPLAKPVLEWAAAGRETPAIPETTYSLYREYQRTGARRPYEAPYFGKRTLLTQEVIALWLGDEAARVERINDVLWSICEETTWVLPAHERTEWTIDLFASETAVELAHVLLLVGDRLPEEVRHRVVAEIKTRIMDRYLEHGEEYWWVAGRNNWTGVCAGSIGQVFLMMEPDLDRTCAALALVLEQLDRFIEYGFEEDGGCLEGIGYWNYGLIHYVAFAEMLRARTEGAIDLLAQDKLKSIARYPGCVVMGPEVYASFADSHEASSVRPFLASRLADRVGASTLLPLIGGTTDWRVTTVIRNLIWWDGRVTPFSALDNAVLPVSGIVRIVDTVGEGPLVLMAKAGHNGEPHNNNDVGSFILRIGNQTYLCDPGGGLYSKDYFSSKRYENVFANSYGHSVPRVNGQLQKTGSKYRGTLEADGGHQATIVFQDAYGIEELTSASRMLGAEGGMVTLEDRYAFTGGGMPVEEAFITWLDVTVEGNTARVDSSEGHLDIAADRGVFKTERLEQACRDNQKSGMLTRITLDLDPAPETQVRFTMTYHGRPR